MLVEPLRLGKFLGFPCAQGSPEAARFNDWEDRTRLLARQSQMVVHYTDRSGRARITGGADLKRSQAYPKKLFGLNGDVFCFSPLQCQTSEK